MARTEYEKATMLVGQNNPISTIEIQEGKREGVILCYM